MYIGITIYIYQYFKKFQHVKQCMNGTFSVYAVLTYMDNQIIKFHERFLWRRRCQPRTQGFISALKINLFGKKGERCGRFGGPGQERRIQDTIAILQ